MGLRRRSSAARQDSCSCEDGDELSVLAAGMADLAFEAALAELVCAARITAGATGSHRRSP
jgi:hypothetical protein